MPFVPMIINDKSAQVGAPGSHATGENFGAQIGAAQQQLGAAIKSLGSAFSGMGKEDAAKADALTQATALATDSFQQTQNDIEINYPDPSGAGLSQTVRDKNLSWIDQRYEADIKGGMSKKNADAVKLARMRQVPGNVDQAANQQTKMGAENGILTSKDALANLQNDVFLHGATSQTEFQKRLELGSQILNNQAGLSANEKKEGKINFANDLGHARFDAMLRAAKSGADVLALKQELNTPYWKGMFKTPELERQALQLDQSAQRWGAIGEDTHVNAIRASAGNYDTYTKETKAGLDELIKVPNADPALQAKSLQNYRSKTAASYFEAQAEQLALQPSEENKAGLQKLQQDIKDPKWSGEMTQEDYKAQTNSIQNHIDRLDNELDRIHTKADTAYNKLTNMRQSEHNVSLKHALEISKSEVLPDDALHELFSQRAQLLGELTAEEQDTYHTIMVNQEYVRKTKGLPPSGMDRVKRETLNGETRFRRIAGPGRAGAGGGGGLSYTAPNGVRVDSGIIDSTSVKGMQPRAYQILDGMVEAAPRAGIARLVITAAKGGGHKSHGEGTEWDIVGYRADGSRWNAEGRAVVAEGARDSPGRADRFGLYEGGNGSLHVGYSGPGRPPAYWGAGGLTGGEASRNYREPASRAFLAGGRGSGVGGPSAGGGFYKALSGFEASNENKPHSYATTSSGMARGYFQITDGTWKDFGGLATGYKTAYDAPYDVQKQIADKIPMARWAPETLNKMQKAGYVIYPTKTLAENAALNNDSGVGGPVGASRDIAPAGTNADVAQGAEPTAAPGVTPMDQPVASGGVVAASDAVRGAGIIDSLATQQQQAIDKDLMTFYETQAGRPLPPLQSDGTGWAERVKDYGMANDYFETSGKQRQPFKEAELAANKNIMASADTDSKLRLYGNIAKWPVQMQHEAFKQLDTVDPFNSAVGRLFADNRIGLARSAMAGDGLTKSASQGSAKAVWQQEANDAFIPTIGDALVGMDPEVASTKKQVYEAIYADKFGVNKPFDPVAYEKIVEDVESGKFDVTNGQRVLTPVNVRSGDMELALASPTLNWTQLSLTGTEPLSGNAAGELAPVQVWGKETARPVRVGDGVYMFIGEDGVPFQTRLPDGSVKRFAMTLSTDIITKAAEHEISIRTDAPTRGFDNPPAKYGVPGLPGGMGGLMEAPAITPVKEPLTGYEPPRAIPRIIETSHKRSLEVYRAALLKAGISKDRVEKDGQDFIEYLRRSWLNAQGYKGG